MKYTFIALIIFIITWFLYCETNPTIPEILIDTEIPPINVGQSLPQAYELGYPYPNPFSSETNFTVKLPRESYLLLFIQNPLGDIIKILVSHTLPAGIYRVVWNGINDDGAHVDEGFFFITMEVKNNNYKRSIPIEYKK
jgi:hypothetical protein